MTIKRRDFLGGAGGILAAAQAARALAAAAPSPAPARAFNTSYRGEFLEQLAFPMGKADLAAYANPQRPGYALGHEGGLLLCTWPKGGALSLPFVYSNEVWTGIEYQCASHMIRSGLVEEGLEVVRTCRARYDGRVRNPFDEYEYGHWYARAMASYALLEALSGARYDAVEKILYLKPRLKGDFHSFLSTATGYGTVGVRNGQPFVNAVSGTIPFTRIDYTPA